MSRSSPCCRLALLLAPLLAIAPGCFSTSSPAVGDPAFDLSCPDPVIRQAAIHEAARTGDRAAIPFLIENLRDPDPWIRTASLRALQQILDTTETHGYDPVAPVEEREVALRRWEEQWRRK